MSTQVVRLPPYPFSAALPAEVPRACAESVMQVGQQNLFTEAAPEGAEE